MPCQLRPDERQHGCNQGSNKGEARVGLRLEAAGTVGCRPSEYRMGLHTVRMTLAPGSERDKPLDSRKLNRYHGRSFVRARVKWQIL